MKKKWFERGISIDGDDHAVYAAILSLVIFGGILLGLLWLGVYGLLI